MGSRARIVTGWVGIRGSHLRLVGSARALGSAAAESSDRDAEELTCARKELTWTVGRPARARELIPLLAPGRSGPGESLDARSEQRT